MTPGASEGDPDQSGVELLGWSGVGRRSAGGLGAVKSPLDDDGGGRGGSPGVDSLRRAVNDSRDRRRRRRACGRENARRLVMCAVPRRVAVARGCRLDSRRQRPGAMAHLHGGSAVCTRARHEARRHQQASRQRRQEQQSYQQASLPLLEPGCPHQGSLVEKRRGARLRDFPYGRSPIRGRWPGLKSTRRASRRPWRRSCRRRGRHGIPRGALRGARRLRRRPCRIERRLRPANGHPRAPRWRSRRRRP